MRRVSGNAQRLLPTAQPTRQHHVVQVTDMVVMMMRDKDRVHLGQRHTGADQLLHHATAGVEQQIVATESDQRCRAVARRIGSRPACAEQYHRWFLSHALNSLPS